LISILFNSERLPSALNLRLVSSLLSLGKKADVFVSEQLLRVEKHNCKMDEKCFADALSNVLVQFEPIPSNLLASGETTYCVSLATFLANCVEACSYPSATRKDSLSVTSERAQVSTGWLVL